MKKLKLKKKSLQADILIFGLGNPGQEYRNTRHNIGFWVVDLLAVKFKAKKQRRTCKSEFFEAELAGKAILLVKPQTYVNESGQSVLCLLKKTNLKREDIIVIHDDIDLPKGKVRIRTGGSSGGHRGIDSIIERTRTSDFIRVKIGVGRPPKFQDPADFVLEEVLDEDETEILNRSTIEAVHQTEQLLLKELKAEV